MSKEHVTDDLPRSILTAIPVGVLVTSYAGDIIYANPKADDAFGFDRGELLGRSIEELIPERYRKSHIGFRENYLASQKTSAMSNGRMLIGVKKNGEEFQLQIGLTPVAGTYTLATFIESTNKIIKPSVSNDPLTGLANRQLLIDYGMKLSKLAMRNKDTLSAMLIDIDDFKIVNDQFGHHIGDLVICEIASILRRSVRENDIVARIGGDEFVILLYGVKDLKKLERLSRVLIEKISSINSINGNSIDIGASVGATMTRFAESVLINDMIAKADKLMYDVKAAGKGSVIVNEV